MSQVVRPRVCPKRPNTVSLLLWALCVWIALPLTAARADSIPVYLEWERPLGSTCPPAKVLEQDVEETLDRPVFTSQKDAQLYILGFIEEHDDSTSVRLSARNRKGALLGTRELHATGGGCAALRSDIVLVLTLLVEREQLLSEATPDLRTSFGPSGTLMVHVLPRWSAGVGPTLVLDIADSLQLRWDLTYFLPVPVRTASGLAANLHAVSLTMRACPYLFGGSDSAWSLHACGGLQVGTWLIAQTEPSERALQLRLLAQGLVELRAGLRVGSGAKLELSAGPSLAISRTSVYASYAADSPVFLYRVPLVGAQLQLGLVF
jgi:hypothetical protein